MSIQIRSVILEAAMKQKGDLHEEALTRHYGKIGVAAVAAAARFQGERKNTKKSGASASGEPKSVKQKGGLPASRRRLP